MKMDHYITHRPYLVLFIMSVISFKLMYLLMYAMVDVWGNVFNNYNQFYMALLMVSPMILLELVLMGQMYQDKKKNALFALAAILLFSLAWIGVRGQKAIGDEQFLRSMISHHAGAILMCEKASLEDEELKTLCRNIISSQQAEIDFMKAKLKEINP
jgi:hypothetical protein